MTDTISSIVDQRIKEYDMRLKHLDNLLGQAQKKVSRGTGPENTTQLAKLKQERDKLASWVDEIKRKPVGGLREEDIMKAGPMGVWDAIAQQLERLVEHIDR